SPTRFPYTALFRSRDQVGGRPDAGQAHHRPRRPHQDGRQAPDRDPAAPRGHREHQARGHRAAAVSTSSTARPSPSGGGLCRWPRGRCVVAGIGHPRSSGVEAGRGYRASPPRAPGVEVGRAGPVHAAGTCHPGLGVSEQSEEAGARRVRVLVTGASGFVGRAVTAALSRAGHDVVPLSRRPKQAAGPVADIRDQAAVHTEVADVDAVCHLAAVTRPRMSASNPAEYWTVNTGGTFNVVSALLATAKRTRPKRLVLASTAAMYAA